MLLKTAIIQDITTLQIIAAGLMNDAGTQTLQNQEVVELLDVDEKKIDLPDFQLVQYKELPTHWLIEVRGEVQNTVNTKKAAFLDYLSDIIAERKSAETAGSYTARLFEKGLNKIAQKVGEEAVELVIEAKDDDKELFLGEAADLLFHFLVLLEAKEIDLHEVITVLEKRHKK